VLSCRVQDEGSIDQEKPMKRYDMAKPKRGMTTDSVPEVDLIRGYDSENEDVRGDLKAEKKTEVNRRTVEALWGWKLRR
jgi:hypothetical protein